MNKFILLVLIFISNFAFAEKVTAERVLSAFDSSDKNEVSVIIDDANQQANSLDATTLILLSGLALQIEDFKSSGVFYYQCMLRGVIDGETFPIKNKTLNNKLAKVSALIVKISPIFKEYIFYNPEIFSNVVEALPNWQPLCNETYDPGWVYEGEPDYKLCNEKFDRDLSGLISVLTERSTLLNHEEYNLLLMEIEGPSINSDLSIEDIENIENRMLAIEKELKIIGPITKKLDK